MGLKAVSRGRDEFVGTVTSVGLALPAEFVVTESPVTESGTLTASWVIQAQNLVFASPASGSGVPSFRSLVAADLPAIPVAGIAPGTQYQVLQTNAGASAAEWTSFPQIRQTINVGETVTCDADYGMMLPGPIVINGSLVANGRIVFI